MKILFLGDTHANIKLVNKALITSKSKRVDLIIQVGDFGYFPNLYPSFLEKINSTIPFYFIDGNHEDHYALQQYQKENAPVEIQDNLFYCPRGIAVKINNLNFMFLGGATSVDKTRRTIGVDYFQEENITQGQLMKFNSNYHSICNGRIDILVTHESPYLPPSMKPFDDVEDHNRNIVKAIYEEYKPSLLVHGHHHKRYNSVNPYGVIYGLGADFSDNTLILDI